MDTLYLYFFAETESSNCGFMNILLFYCQGDRDVIESIDQNLFRGFSFVNPESRRALQAKKP